MITSREFNEKIKEALDEELTRLNTDLFVQAIAGDWRSDIKKLLSTLRSKANTPKEVDYLILYLFAELAEEGKISFTETTFKGEDAVDKSFGPFESECYENVINIYRKSLDMYLNIKLKDENLT